MLPESEHTVLQSSNLKEEHSFEGFSDGKRSCGVQQRKW